MHFLYFISVIIIIIIIILSLVGHQLYQTLQQNTLCPDGCKTLNEWRKFEPRIQFHMRMGGGTLAIEN